MIPDDIPEVTGEVDDDLYDEAVDLIIEMQTASVSMLQRRFRIGYTRAARLIDEMEARGIVGPTKEVNQELYCKQNQMKNSHN